MGRVNKELQWGPREEEKLRNLFQTVSRMEKEWAKVEKHILYSSAEDKNDRVA